MRRSFAARRLRMTVQPRLRMTAKKDRGHLFVHGLLKASESLFDFNDLFFVVGAACLADLVRYHQRTAFAALDQCRIAHLPVCSAAVSSCLRGLILGTNRHMIHLLRSQSRPRTESSPKSCFSIIAKSSPAVNCFFQFFQANFRAFFLLAFSLIFAKINAEGGGGVPCRNDAYFQKRGTAYDVERSQKRPDGAAGKDRRLRPRHERDLL